MKIARIKSGSTILWFEPRGKAVEPCVYIKEIPEGMRVGAGWIDFSDFTGSGDAEHSEKPNWNTVGAVRIAQDFFRELEKAGTRGAPLLARLSVSSPDYWADKIDNRSRLGQAARDIFILLMLPVWEKRKWTHAERAHHLNASGRWFFKSDGEKNWRALADRTKDLEKKFRQ